MGQSLEKPHQYTTATENLDEVTLPNLHGMLTPGAEVSSRQAQIDTVLPALCEWVQVGLHPIRPAVFLLSGKLLPDEKRTARVTVVRNLTSLAESALMYGEH